MTNTRRIENYGKMEDAWEQLADEHDKEEALETRRDISSSVNKLAQEPTQQTESQKSYFTGSNSRLQCLETRGPARSTLFSKPKEQEKELRQILADRTSLVKDEEKYALRDGPVVELAEKEEAVESEEPVSEVESESERLKRRMGRLTKRRAYPLFLAEKASELVEGILPKDSNPLATKEKIVVLGTGWGAVSLLKGIDTSRFDVTVISPRNYFLFTPMLGMSKHEMQPVSQPS